MRAEWARPDREMSLALHSPGSGRNGNSVAHLFREDPDLLRHVSRHAAERLAGQVAVPVEHLPLGAWKPPERAPGRGFLGFLVLDGLLAREVRLDEKRGIELLGRGDLLRPDEPEAYSVPASVTWRVLMPARIASLDDLDARLLSRMSGTMAELIDRAAHRAASLGIQLAIANVHPLTKRLRVLFWHLADRWGHRRVGAVVLPLRLTHEVLAEIACAERPPVSSALRDLTRRGLISQLPDHGWILHGPPPTHAAQALP
jgi:CRP/FNR family cyclic AMP-dependent transcriptional regulator